MRRTGWIVVGLAGALIAAVVVASVVRPDISRNEAFAVHMVNSLKFCAEHFQKTSIRKFPSRIEEMDYLTWGNAPCDPILSDVVRSKKAWGYVFTVQAGKLTPEKTCYASAVPEKPGWTGVRTFVMSIDGVLYSSPTGSPPVYDYLPSDGGAGSPGCDFLPPVLE